MALLLPSGDTEAAGWIAGSATPWEQLVTFGPAGFAAYARLRFIPDPVRPGQAEADVDLPADHLDDLGQTRLALHRLAAVTGSTDRCHVLVWEGYSDVPLPPAVTSLVVLPHRRYALFEGPLAGLDAYADELGSVAPPAFVWPADRRWCFAADVDPHWAGIGTDAAAIAALVADEFLDIVPSRPEGPQPLYY